MNDEPLSPQAEEVAAIDRIASSADGLLLHRFLRRELEACINFQDSGALRAHHGRRTLARDLMALMAEGIARAGHDQPRDYKPILTRSGQLPAGRRHPGLARRVLPDPAVAAFLNEHGADAPG